MNGSNCTRKEKRQREEWKSLHADGQRYAMLLYRYDMCKHTYEGCIRSCLELGLIPVMDEERACVERLKAQLDQLRPSVPWANQKSKVKRFQDFAKRLDQEGLYEAVGIFPVIQTTRGFIMCGMYGHRELYALEGAGYPIHRHVPPGAKHLQYGSRFSYFFKCMPCLGGKWHSFVHEE